jgi:hypothetical protein
VINTTYNVRVPAQRHCRGARPVHVASRHARCDVRARHPVRASTSVFVARCTMHTLTQQHDTYAHVLQQSVCARWPVPKQSRAAVRQPTRTKSRVSHIHTTHHISQSHIIHIHTYTTAVTYLKHVDAQCAQRWQCKCCAHTHTHAHHTPSPTHVPMTSHRASSLSASSNITRASALVVASSASSEVSDGSDTSLSMMPSDCVRTVTACVCAHTPHALAILLRLCLRCIA